jgi:hypothetical protein
VAILVPTLYSAQKIESNLVARVSRELQIQPLSLSLVPLPRSRAAEKHTNYPCGVEGVDQTGFGPFGCLIFQLARPKYRQRFAAGLRVGFVQELSPRDFLILYAEEK